MRTEVHGKEVKFKRMVRLGSLNNILTKERGFGCQGTINCRRVNQKIYERTNGR